MDAPGPAVADHGEGFYQVIEGPILLCRLQQAGSADRYGNRGASHYAGGPVSPKGYRPDTWKRRAGKWKQPEPGVVRVNPLRVPAKADGDILTDWESLVLLESARECLAAALRQSQRGSSSSVEACLRSALDVLAGIKTGKPGPKPECMCGPCVKHRTADRSWRAEHKAELLKYNRERQQRIRDEKKNGGKRPGEPTDEELDRRASEWLRASGV